MARRALRKLKNKPDISQHLLGLEQLPLPWSQEVLFGRCAPLELEIGSGKGHFLRRAARQFPDHDFLGIEISEDYAEYCAQHLALRNIPNAKMLCDDAAKLLTEVLPDESLHAVHVYFPDPWWKRKHRKRRILRSDVVQMLYRHLIPGGILHFWTDVLEYYESTLILIAKTTEFEGPHLIPEPEDTVIDDYRTHFERRTRLHGEPVYRSFFVKPLLSRQQASATF